MPGITYGGISLCADSGLEDAQDEIRKALDCCLPIQDFTRGEPNSNHLLPSSDWHQRQGPSFIVENRHPPELNVLRLPTGATRWATFYALIAGDDLTKLLGYSNNGSIPLYLKLDDGVNPTPITVSMYHLTPRPICNTSAIRGNKPKELYLLPLVDGRYWWQFNDTGALSLTLTSAWSDALAITSNLSPATFTVSSTPSGYSGTVPDPTELSRNYSNAAELLDAVASSLGMRVVMKLDGTVKIIPFTEDATIWDANWTNAFQSQRNLGYKLADNSGAGMPIPAGVKVTFPKWYYGAPDQLGAVYSKTVTPPNPFNDSTKWPTIGGTNKLIHTTAFADYSSGSIANQTACDALATQIASDYYQRYARQCDVCFSGLVLWVPTAFDDFVEWRMGSRVNGEYQCSTRVKSLDHNWGTEEMYHQFSTKYVHEGIQPFTLTGTLSTSAGSTAPATFNVHPADTLVVTNAFGSVAPFYGSIGAQGLTAFNGELLEWIIVVKDCN